MIGPTLALLLLTASTTGAQDTLVEPVVIPDLPELKRPNAMEQAEAQQAYAQSVKLYEAGDRKGALAAARRLYEIMPNASTAIVLAKLLDSTGRPCAAFATLAAALDMDPTQEERAAIRQSLRQAGRSCKPGAAWARVQVVPEDAQLRVDGRDIPAGRTVVLRAGEHAVEVEAPGHARLRATINAAPGEEVPARFETEKLLPDAAPVEAPGAYGHSVEQPLPSTTPATLSDPAEAPTGAPPSTLVPWLLTGGGAALLATGIGVNVWAVKTASDARGYLSPTPDMSDEDRREAYNDAGDKATTRATTAYILYGVGAAALGTGIVMLLISPEAEEAASWQPSAWAVPGGAGLSLGGAF